MQNQLFRRNVLALLAVCVVWCSLSSVRAGEDKNDTVVSVKEMCGGCVKKITKHFENSKYVGKLKCDIEGQTVAFAPKKDSKIDPLTLWEEMESIGKTPTKLVGPSGTFTSKPKKAK